MASERIAAASAGAWQLGDIKVNRMGFGAMRLTGSAAFDFGVPSDRDRSIAVLRRAIEIGVNHIDTAAFYFSRVRSANELINTALAPYPDDLVITTKVGPGRDPCGTWLGMATPEQLRGQVEENIRQLGREYLDVVNLRMPGPGPIVEHLGALAELQDAGLIRHLGVANVVLEQLTEALTVAPIVCVQNRYAVDSRRPGADGVMRACGERGIAFVPFYALAGEGQEQGREDGAKDRGQEVVQAVARAHDATVAQIRLAWTLARGPHVLAIPGTGNPHHLLENVAAGAIHLSDEELASLDAIDAERV